MNYENVYRWCHAHPKLLIAAAISAFFCWLFWAWKTDLWTRRKVKMQAADDASCIVRKTKKQHEVKGKDGKIVGTREEEEWKNIKVKLWHNSNRPFFRQKIKIMIRVEPGVPKHFVESFHPYLCSITNQEWGHFFQEPGDLNTYYAVRASVGE